MPSGFTLIELLVVLAITAIFSAALLVAYPHTRAEQKLTLAEQTLQAVLREAQQLAINEDRAPKCTATLPPLDGGHLQRLCSDIGIALDNTQGEFIMFADTNEPDANAWSSADIELKRIPFPEGVRVNLDSAATTATTFVFQGTPPTVSLFTQSGTQSVIAPEMVTFEIGGSSRKLFVQSYGQVERQ